MRRTWIIAAAALLAIGATSGWLWGGWLIQEPNDEESQVPPSRLPDDPRLIAIHKKFVAEAEKLAVEYERDDELDSAKAVYEQILRLVPEYPKALEGLAKINAKEAAADRKLIEVHANKDWQDTGITLIEGKPVRIVSKGSWTFRMEYDLDSEGIEIPEGLRDFKLGALIGVIYGDDPEQAKPFVVGGGKEFLAERTGRLLLRMHDSDPSDNSGKISVEIVGTFEEGR